MSNQAAADALADARGYGTSFDDEYDEYAHFGRRSSEVVALPARPSENRVGDAAAEQQRRSAPDLRESRSLPCVERPLGRSPLTGGASGASGVSCSRLSEDADSPPVLCPYHAMLCYAMLCDAVRCCAMLCDAVRCCAVLFYAVLCCAMRCCAMLCGAVLCYAVLCCAVLCCAVQCCDMRCYAMLCGAVLCYTVLCCVLCCAMLCNAVQCRARCFGGP